METPIPSEETSPLQTLQELTQLCKTCWYLNLGLEDRGPGECCSTLTAEESLGLLWPACGRRAAGRSQSPTPTPNGQLVPCALPDAVPMTNARGRLASDDPLVSGTWCPALHSPCTREDEIP